MNYNKTLEEGLKEFDSLLDDFAVGFGEGASARNLHSFLTTFAEKIREGVMEEVKQIVNNESAIDGQYLEPSFTRKMERERITKRLDDLLAQLKNSPAIKGEISN